MSDESDFLYAKPSFSEGVARLVDFGNTLNTYNKSKTGAEADAKALRSDWNVVGKEMRKAVTHFEAKHTPKKNK